MTIQVYRTHTCNVSSWSLRSALRTFWES